MQDAVTALRSAIDELTQARETLPEDLAEEVTAVIEQAGTVLEAVTAKLGDGEA